MTTMIPTSTPTFQPTDSLFSNPNSSGYGAVIGVIVFVVFILSVFGFVCLKCIIRRYQSVALIRDDSITALPNDVYAIEATATVVNKGRPISLDSSCVIEIATATTTDNSTEQNSTFDSHEPYYNAEAVEPVEEV